MRKEWEEDYDVVYNNFGESIKTRCCNAPMKFDGYGYICPDCKRKISRREFFTDYGVHPYGPECLTCNTNFPLCIICHRGHQDECDHFNADYWY